MSVTVNRETAPVRRSVFANVFELFPGGFGWSARAVARNTTVVELPKGALLRIDEDAQTAHPVKRGRVVTLASGSTGVDIMAGSMFQAGDVIRYAGVATGHTISAVVDRANYVTHLTLATATTGSAAAGSTVDDFAGGDVTGTANAIAALPSRVEDGASVSVLRRGTVFTNRVQPIQARDSFPTGGAILFNASS